MPSYFSSIYEKVKPGGRFLNHCITRSKSTDKAIDKGGFIDRYVFPDGELTAAGPLATNMQDAGFELRHLENLREHYGMTCAAWGRNLEANWDEAVAEVGAPRAKVWQIYLAGSRLNFERDEIELHQILGRAPRRRERALPAAAEVPVVAAISSSRREVTLPPSQRP